MKSIYLDNAATTYPKSEQVYMEMDRVNRTLAFNAGRGSYALARTAIKIIDATREKLLTLISATTVAEAVLTASATVALNEIIGGIEWKRADVVYVSPYEHNAVARPLELMRKRYGIEIRELPLLDGSQQIDVDMVEYLFKKDRPRAVIVTHISNVTGYILPVKKIFELADGCGAIKILDASQSLGLLDIDMQDIKADIIAFAGHKNLYGPFGCGGFYIRNGLELSPYLAGGTGSDSLNLNMPQGVGRYEPASPNIVAISGLQAALDSLEDVYEREKELTLYMVEKLKSIPEVELYLPPKEKHIGIVAFNVEGYQADEVGMLLDEDYKIAVRSGYHCAPFIHKHIGDISRGGVVRASIGRGTTEADIDALVKAIEDIKEM